MVRRKVADHRTNKITKMRRTNGRPSNICQIHKQTHNRQGRKREGEGKKKSKGQCGRKEGSPTDVNQIIKKKKEKKRCAHTQEKGRSEENRTVCMNVCRSREKTRVGVEERERSSV